jgi:hypothetical protein
MTEKTAYYTPFPPVMLVVDVPTRAVMSLQKYHGLHQTLHQGSTLPMFDLAFARVYISGCSGYYGINATHAAAHGRQGPPYGPSQEVHQEASQIQK